MSSVRCRRPMAIFPFCDRANPAPRLLNVIEGERPHRRAANEEKANEIPYPPNWKTDDASCRALSTLYPSHPTKSGKNLGLGK